MPRSYPIALSVCAALALSGCQNSSIQQSSRPAPQPAMKAAPATPIEEKKEQLGSNTWDPHWDVLVEQALPPDMLSAQAAVAVKSYCPNFAQEPEADKRAFWAYLFQALAGAEAGLNPTSDVHHTAAAVAKTDSVTRRPIRQEGLMQVAYEDSKNYGCDFDWPHDRTLPEKDPSRTILQPANNLACGLKIMENQIVSKKQPLLARASYWSTLQPGTPSYRMFAKQMANVPPACKPASPPTNTSR